MKIEKIVKPEQQIASFTTKTSVANLPNLIGPTFMRLAGYIRSQGAEIISSPFVSYKGMDENGQMEGDQIEVEIGFPLDRPIAEADGIKSYLLPSYRAMTTLFKGSYDDLTSPYITMLKRIKEENGQITGVSYEYYLTDEEISSDQHETLLEIVYQ